MRFALKDPMLVTIRVEGKFGAVRELSAVIDFNSPYCTVLSQDAIDLGYPEGGNKHNERERTHPEETPRFTSMRGIDRGIRRRPRGEECRRGRVGARTSTPHHVRLRAGPVLLEALQAYSRCEGTVRFPDLSRFETRRRSEEGGSRLHRPPKRRSRS